MYDTYKVGQSVVILSKPARSRERQIIVLYFIAPTIFEESQGASLPQLSHQIVNTHEDLERVSFSR